MATAWQKAMRGAPKANLKYEVMSVVEIRPGTFEIEVDLGRDGWHKVRWYPDGRGGGELHSGTLPSDAFVAMGAVTPLWKKIVDSLGPGS